MFLEGDLIVIKKTINNKIFKVRPSNIMTDLLCIIIGDLCCHYVVNILMILLSIYDTEVDNFYTSSVLLLCCFSVSVYAA